MAIASRQFVPNQVFLGLPWKNVRPRYERVIAKLEKKFPIYLTIVGRNDAQHAEDLFEIIKNRIASSSHAIFDATGGNANVSLEYGYAEGVGVPRVLFLSTHGAAQRTAGSPIISDLGGQRRIQYKTEKSLSNELHKFCREHAYTIRFEKALTSALKGLSKGAKKSGRALALKLVRVLDGEVEIRRADLVQRLQAQGYAGSEIEALLKKLHAARVINCSVGRESKVRIA
jgi:hypothetical protein